MINTALLFVLAIIEIHVVAFKELHIHTHSGINIIR